MRFCRGVRIQDTFLGQNPVCDSMAEDGPAYNGDSRRCLTHATHEKHLDDLFDRHCSENEPRKDDNSIDCRATPTEIPVEGRQVSSCTVAPGRFALR